MKKNTSVFRRVLDGLAPVATAFGFLLLASTAVASPIITDVSMEDGTTEATYGAGTEIRIDVTLDQEILSVGFSDSFWNRYSGSLSEEELLKNNIRLKLNVLSGTGTCYAVYDGWYNGEDNSGHLVFSYTVQPGDFSSALDVALKGFEYGSAIIETSDGDANYATRMSVPTGTSEGSLVDNAEVSIRTITFLDGTMTNTVASNTLGGSLGFLGIFDPLVQQFFLAHGHEQGLHQFLTARPVGRNSLQVQADTRADLLVVDDLHRFVVHVSASSPVGEKLLLVGHHGIVEFLLFRRERLDDIVNFLRHIPPPCPRGV